LKEGREPRKVEIENYSDYFVTRRGSRTETGTTITLFLKDDVEVDLIEELKEYAQHVEFPIYVADGENEETIVDHGYDFNFVDYMNPLYKQYADELNPYVIDFEKEGIEGLKGKLFFTFFKDENDGYGWKSKKLNGVDLQQLFEKKRFEGRLQKRGFLSQDGILIMDSTEFKYPSKIILPPWISSTIFFNVNLEEESKVDLTIDRSDVVVNDKLNNLKAKIEKIIIGHIEKIFSQKHLVMDKDKSRLMECFFESFCESSPFHYSFITPPFVLGRMKKIILFKCFVNGKIKYLTYNELKDRYKFFYHRPCSQNDSIKRNAIKKAYPEDPVIYPKGYEKIPLWLLKFSGEQIIVTNKELGFSLDKYLLVPSAEKRDKKEKGYGFTFEGDYKDCFGTVEYPYFGTITPNVNHPFMKLVNKNIDTFRGEDKKDHEFFIDFLLRKTDRDHLTRLEFIQRTQRYFLDFYVEKGILTKEEVEMYLLTEKDFCPYDMGEDFLKQ
jgi:hypothetical protein